MSGHVLSAALRRAAIAFSLAAGALAGASCSGDEVTGPEVARPADPGELTGVPAPAAAASSPLTFVQISSGGFHTCGIAGDHKAYCWGNGGLLGDGTEIHRTAPVPVAGGLSFRQVSAGEYHTCGVTTAGRAYCWGEGGNGELGNGVLVLSTTPVAVATGMRFRAVVAGSGQSCGLREPDRRAFCWGFNNFGQVGDGTTINRPKPVAVAGNRTFRQLSASRGHTCGVTPAYEAYCWGDNSFGALGIGTSTGLRTRPALVTGGHAFVQVDAGGGHTCGATTSHAAFCWGYGLLGQIGDGRNRNRAAPRAVAFGLSFTRVSAGMGHTCGETTDNLAYCWGADNYGQLGDGSTIYESVPVPVAGGHTFAQVSSSHGGTHNCAITAAGAAWCWGSNVRGELGDGTFIERHVPVAVVGGT